MLNRIISWSLQNRFLVILVTLVLATAGILSLKNLNLDAFPDVTPIQVQVNAVAPSLNPVEIEQQVTFPIERKMSGLPGLVNIRSISKFGFCQVILTFEDKFDIYLARQLTSEKLQEVALPEGLATPSLGPISTGLGEVLHYHLESDRHSLQELTTIQNWIIKPRLASVPGVAEINTWGGKKKQYQVVVDLNGLMKYRLGLADIVKALRENNLNVGGGNVSQGGEYHLVHGVGIVTSLKEIEQIMVSHREGVPIYIKDLARVIIGHEIRRGAMTAKGKGESVLGLGFMLQGENSFEITKRLVQKIEAIQGDLPGGVKIRILYKRTDLIDAVIHTVKENLLVGALLVIATLFWFMGSLRAGLIVALAIPLSMLFAFIEMVQFGIAGSLMSLGAIDFGLIVDSSVIVVENSMRKLAENDQRQCPVKIVEQATLEVRKPTMYGELIILVVFIPILALEGIEGKLFIPMALTMIFALAGSLVLSLTLTPVLASLFLPTKLTHQQTRLMRWAKAIYKPVLSFSIRFKGYFIAAGLALVIMGILLASKLGTEFIPRLDEGSVVINTIRLAGISLDESIRYGNQIEKHLLRSFPDEIQTVWTRTGTAQIATDPMGLELSDVYITLKPRKSWKQAQTQGKLVEKIRRELESLPAMRMVFTQPIEMRVNEMTAGIRADLGVKIYGDSFEKLKEVASEIGELLEKIPGSSDIYVEQISGQGILRFKVRQDALARHGLSTRDVLKFVQGIGVIEVGEIREGQLRFDLIVRLEDKFRKNPEAIGSLLVTTGSGKLIRLEDLVTIEQTEGPSTITREWQKRRISVQCNVRNQDLGGFVQEVKRRIQAQKELPPGYHIEYGGQFENLQRARNRLMIIVPAALFLILCLLLMSTGKLTDSFIIFTGAPFAAIGGIAMLWIRDMPFTISAAVGFVAVCGVAMLNGLVMMATIRQKMEEGSSVEESVFQGALLRLRPVLMTALVAAFGFVPMAFNTGIGAEVQRPLATVVLGGVFSDCLLTLCVLPALAVSFIAKGLKGSDQVSL
ncbi:efflux RND transporter permease subunit [bacterium]|jgi:heavy metal efflux system protein|nr:efflux RND transporter permease subunit [bacterium]